jgi:putative phosphoesterase
VRIGLISDTHGLLRPEAVEALRGVDRILHAGDIGKPAVLSELEALAPVEAIAGNVDRKWCALPEARWLTIADHRVLLVHDWRSHGPVDGPALVVCGHSHRPGISVEGDLLVVNPGSAGPRRFSLPVSVGFVTLGAGGWQAETLTLEVPPPRRRARR